MTTFELEEYLEANSQIVDNFRDKYAAFLNEQNADRPTNKKWSSLRIKNETSSAVIKFIISIHNKISTSMGSAQRKHRANWINYIEKHEIIYRLEKSMADMVFEG
ncbi:hypothetical protein AZI11_14320 (plasmid) [Levilactobacillus brevis]|uniref:hypothetical protein n=1 Tax=Levilactobacillus brevis TaxID=1580 RepID=UPI000A209232|nr:hypothetical protein [Levilactobacillus brevis]ARN94084.1 hypothetical protein AZI11_14320 [Levilactobacillus brevis]